MSTEPENLVLQLLREIRSDIGGLDRRIDGVERNMATKEEVANKDDVASLRSGLRDVASDLTVTRKELSNQIVGLRRAMIDDHTSVVGHDNLIANLEARVRRREQHLDLPSLGH